MKKECFICKNKMGFFTGKDKLLLVDMCDNTKVVYVHKTGGCKFEDTK